MLYSVKLILVMINLVSSVSPPPLSQECRAKGFSRAPLILIALDGFHPDFLKRPSAKSLNILKSNGVSSSYMRPVYPTKTFPNLYTIVTGLYPESHGIVGNHFYDPVSKNQFFHSKSETHYKIKWGGEPIWITAKKNGINYAVRNWPGNTINFDGIGTNTMSQGKLLYKEKIDEILSYMKISEDKRPGFITLYFSEPDHTIHRFGPDSKEANKAIFRVSESVYLLYEQLVIAKIDKCVNVIVVSDHGMTSTQCNGLIYLNQISDLSRVALLSGPNAMIYQYKSRFYPQQIFNKMRCHNNLNRLFDVYKRHNFPTRHHYTNNDRIGDVLVKMAEGHKLFKHGDRNPDCNKIMGDHGYDDGLRSMQGIFMAFGPYFKGKKQILPFQNIELYNLMAVLLGIEPAPNNGTYGLLADALTIEHHPNDIGLLIKSVNYYGLASDQKLFPDGGYFSSDDDNLSKIKKFTHSKKFLKTPQSPNRHKDKKNYLRHYGAVSQSGQMGHYVSKNPKINKKKNHQEKCCLNQNIKTCQRGQISLSPSKILPLLNRLVPFEIPKSIFVPTSILPDHNFIIGYDEQNNYPLWVSYLGKNSFAKQNEGRCLNVDPRVSIYRQMAYCQLPKDIRTASGSKIIPLKLCSSDNGIGNTLTNVVYVYKAFYTNIWSETIKFFEDFAAKRSANVMIGPVFDKNGDGLLDNNLSRYYKKNNILKPSHIFVIISHCKSNTINQCKAKDMTLNSFVIPHNKDQENCEATNEYFKKHYVRVKDIELLTGLRFFTKYPEHDRIKLITYFPLNLNQFI